MEFLQWLYDYAAKTAPSAAGQYSGYEKRVEAFKKQLGVQDIFPQQIIMSPHLIPNKASLRGAEGGVDSIDNSINNSQMHPFF